MPLKTRIRWALNEEQRSICKPCGPFIEMMLGPKKETTFREIFCIHTSFIWTVIYKLSVNSLNKISQNIQIKVSVYISVTGWEHHVPGARHDASQHLVAGTSSRGRAEPKSLSGNLAHQGQRCPQVSLLVSPNPANVTSSYINTCILLLRTERSDSVGFLFKVKSSYLTPENVNHAANALGCRMGDKDQRRQEISVRRYERCVG